MLSYVTLFHFFFPQSLLNACKICACAVPLRPVVGRFIIRFQRFSNMAANVRRPNVGVKTTERSQISHKTSRSGESGQPSTAPITQRERDAWVALMSRTIDLEGIAEDGFGYKVTISGPSKQNSKLQKRQSGHDAKGFWQRQGGRGVDDRERLGQSIALEVTTKTTFDVEEKQLGPWERTTFAPYSGSDPEIGIEQAALQLKDWSSLNPSQAYDSH